MNKAAGRVTKRRVPVLQACSTVSSGAEGISARKPRSTKDFESLSTDGINWSKSNLPFTTFKISSANNRFFSAGYPFVWSSSEIMSLEARPTQLQIFGPIGKIVTIHSTDSIGGPLTSTTVSLTSMPTIINNSNAFVFGSIN